MGTIWSKGEGGGCLATPPEEKHAVIWPPDAVTQSWGQCRSLSQPFGDSDMGVFASLTRALFTLNTVSKHRLHEKIRREDTSD